MKRLVLLTLCCVWALFCVAFADMEIHYLDVGEADATVICCDGEVMVIDGGKPEYSQFIYSYLRKTLNVENVKYVFISHPHDDHIGGIPAVLNACRVEHVFSPIVYYPGEPFESVMSITETQSVPFDVANQGDELMLEGQAAGLYLRSERVQTSMTYPLYC